jgi:hypothetical protein
MSSAFSPNQSHQHVPILAMRKTTTALILTLPTLTLANGAMGLGLEMFQLSYWLVYVVVIVVFEAWWIGRKSGVSWATSLSVSALANLCTALMCPQVFAPLFHQSFLGSQLNPNPFGNAVVLFVVFGFLSAILEFLIWHLVAKQMGLLRRSIVAHMLSVPVALAILLVPVQPYQGLQAFARHPRRWGLERWAQRTLAVKIQEDGRVPTVRSVEDAITTVRSDEDPVDLWAAAYAPNFNRFSTGETRSKPYLWNSDLNSKKIGGDEHWVWLIRPPELKYMRVIEIDLSTGMIKARNYDAKEAQETFGKP